MDIQSASTGAATNISPPRQSLQNGATATESVATARAPLLKNSSDTNQATQDTKVSRQQLDQAVNNVSEFVKTANSSLEFSIDKETGLDLVKVIDSDTKEVIRQIPSEEIVAIAKALDSLKGLLIQQKA